MVNFFGAGPRSCCTSHLLRCRLSFGGYFSVNSSTLLGACQTGRHPLDADIVGSFVYLMYGKVKFWSSCWFEYILMCVGEGNKRLASKLFLSCVWPRAPESISFSSFILMINTIYFNMLCLKMNSILQRYKDGIGLLIRTNLSGNTSLSAFMWFDEWNMLWRFEDTADVLWRDAYI